MRYPVVLILLTFLAAAGCSSHAGSSQWHSGELTDVTGVPLAGRDDLAVTVSLTSTSSHLTTGQAIDAMVTITNLTDRPVRIDSPTSVRLYVYIWRYTEAGWTKILRYPQSELHVVTPWGIAPDASVGMTLPLVIEPNWPTYETLRLTAAVNGANTTSEPIIFRVASKPADKR